MKTKRIILLGVVCFFIIGSVTFVIKSGAIFQRGNPLPYISKMLTLNNNNSYAKVFDDEDVFITRGDADEFIKYIENTYDVTYIEQMGSCHFFRSDEKIIVADAEVYWKYYIVWELQHFGPNWE